MRLLIFRLGTIGDVVVAIPAIREYLTKTNPTHVVLLSDEASLASRIGAASVFEQTGLIDAFLAHPSRRTPLGIAKVSIAIRRMNFDTVLYLPPRTRTTREILRDRVFFRMCGLRSVVGPTVARITGSAFENKPLKRMSHEGQDLLDVLRGTGIPVAPLSPGSFDLGLTEGERATAASLLGQPGSREEPLVGVAMGAKWPSKQWPPEHFEVLLRRLNRNVGLTPVFVGGPADREPAEDIVRALGSGINLCGRTSVRISATVLERCSLFVGNDSGPMHLAYAVGTPCAIALSAQDLPGRWEPIGVQARVFRREPPCAGCRLAICPRDNECLRLTGPNEMYAACQQLLGAASARI